VVAPEVGEGLGEVGDEVVFISGLDDHIVDVSFDVLANLGFQALLDGLLVGHSNIFEAESHGRVVVDAVRQRPSRLSGDSLSSSRGSVAGCILW
jgi:hypothetical protein